jgi:hypothetical protein
MENTIIVLGGLDQPLPRDRHDMIEVQREGDDYVVVVSESCGAPPEVLYDLLADLKSHLEWGGTRLRSASQRLIALEAPDGPVSVGSEFTSIGHTSGRPWHDRSRVTRADRPYTFEFETHGQLGEPDEGEELRGDWTHRYDISRNGAGSRVVYRMRARLTFPWYTPAGPHRRYAAVIYQIFVPIIVQRGVRSLLAMAEERAGATRPER